MSILYRTIPRLDPTATYEIMGRRCRWIGCGPGKKEQVHEFRVEGDLESSRTYSESEIVALIDAGGFRVASPSARAG
jgi:hypothetical protein